MASTLLTSVLYIVGLYFVGISGDTACLRKNGVCQTDSLWCGGVYQTGLCSGAASSRCCVPPKPACSNVNIVSRSEWAARSSKGASSLSRFPVPNVFVHHTAGTYCRTAYSCKAVVRAIQNYHMDTKRWDDIGYSFLVGGDGTVFEGRGWFRTGAHTLGFNDRSVAFSVMGNYENSTPTSASLTAIRRMIACGVSKGYIKPNYKLSGHRDAAATACPGRNLYNIIKTWPRYSSSP